MFFTICTFLFLSVFISLSFFIQTPKDSDKNPISAAQSLKERCKNQDQKRVCYFSELSDISQNGEFGFALDVLKELQKIDHDTEYCHTFAHRIGYNAVIKNIGNWQNLVKGIDVRDCTYGFLHGIIEGKIMLSGGNFELNENTVQDLCDKVVILSKGKASDDLNERMCVHIMGHMMVFQKNGDINSTIRICQNLNSNSVGECSQGAFMEYDFQLVAGMHQKIVHTQWDENNIKPLEAVCLTYTGIVGKECWKALSDGYVSISQGDYKKIYLLCQNAPAQYVNDCYFSGGYILALRELNGYFDSGNLDMLCEPFFGNQKNLESCIKTIVEYVIWSSPLSSGRFAVFCNKIVETSKGYCYQEYGKNLGKFASIEKRGEVCNKLESKYRDLCMGLHEKKV